MRTSDDGVGRGDGRNDVLDDTLWCQYVTGIVSQTLCQAVVDAADAKLCSPLRGLGRVSGERIKTQLA